MRYVAWIIFASLVAACGCSHDANIPSVTSSSSQRIRVRLSQAVDRVEISAAAPNVAIDAAAGRRVLNFPKDAPVIVTLTADGWRLGSAAFPGGSVSLNGDESQTLRINRVAYRGWFRLVPIDSHRFDVINHVDVDDYVKGVVTREMFASWQPEALKAQAIVARTYALYEARTEGRGRDWDVYPDQRSQVYGGIPGETAPGRAAVDESRGDVVVYGPGEGKIFKTYFSSCCGGVSQAVSDVFGDPLIPPLVELNRGGCCSASKFYNWGPVMIGKDELDRRFKIWAHQRGEALGKVLPESRMNGVARIDVQASNRYGRPTRVLVTDTHGVQFSWLAETLREAVNTSAPSPVDPLHLSALPSDYCKINSDSGSDRIVFYDGHGFGHGVGMCQYCAEARAVTGFSAGQILEDAYPGARILRAY